MVSKIVTWFFKKFFFVICVYIFPFVRLFIICNSEGFNK